MLVSHFGQPLFLRGNPAARTKHPESSHYRPGRNFLLRDNKLYTKFDTCCTFCAFEIELTNDSVDRQLRLVYLQPCSKAR